MVITVLGTGLEGIVIHVTDRSPGGYAGNAKGLKLQIGHGTRSVLRERLVDGKRYGLPWWGHGGYPMGFHDLFDKVLTSHYISLCAKTLKKSRMPQI